MDTMAYQITSLIIVYLTIYSGADQRKHQSSASLAFVRGIHRWPVNSPHNWPVTRKCFHLMTSSWIGTYPAISAWGHVLLSLPYKNAIYAPVRGVSMLVENHFCSESARCSDRHVIPWWWLGVKYWDPGALVRSWHPAQEAEEIRS